MSEKLIALWELQQIDLELEDIDKNNEHQEKVKEIIEIKKHKDKLEHNIMLESEKNIQAGKNATELELQIDANTNQLKIIKDRLYGKVGPSAKETISLEDKEQELARSIDKLEDLYYTKLEEKEASEEKLKALKSQYKKVKGLAGDALASYKNSQLELDKRKKELEEKRNIMVRLVDKDLLNRYNQKRSRYFLVSVSKSMCSNCGIKVSFDQMKALKAMSDLEKCEHCGKYLFLIENK